MEPGRVLDTHGMGLVEPPQCVGFMKIRGVLGRGVIKVGVFFFALGLTSCVIHKTTRIPPAGTPFPAQKASLEELISRLRLLSEGFQTLKATAELAPTVGSIHLGTIQEYRDIKVFILLTKPSRFRMVGQAPVLRTNIFDMVSDGESFRLYIPSKRKFIVGNNSGKRKARNSLENLRPQHLLSALLLKKVDEATEKFFLEETISKGRQFYVVHVVAQFKRGEIRLLRKIWFDRANLEVSRVQRFGPKGKYVQDVTYADYQNFDGVHYPTAIQLTRPVEDYRLAIRIQKATFNQVIGPEKFALEPPRGVERIVLQEEKVVSESVDGR